MMEIKQTIEKAKSGDQSAFYSLYNETYPRNRYIALRYMKQESDVDDVLQDAYIRIFNNLEKFTYQGEGSFMSWTSKIVSNTALNQLRKKNPLLFSETEDEEGNSVILDIVDESVDSQPELSYEKKEATVIVNDLLKDLSEEQRVVTMMYYFQECSVKEIAENCSCSENTVKSRLNYARKNLEKKATDLKKKGVLTTAFSLSVLAILLRDDFASAAVGKGLDKAFGLVWGAVCGGTANAAGAGAAIATGASHFFSAKLLITIGCSAVLGAGIITGVFAWGGFFSSGQGRDDNKPPAVTQEATITPTATDTPTPEPTVTPEPTPEITATPEVEETPTPEETKKPKKTPKPTKKPKPTSKPTPKPTKKPKKTPEPMDWDDDFTDWDDD